MLSNLINQLREQKALDRLKEVLDEIPVVRKDLGYPPLVTPTSQMVGVQSVMNVLLGERYKKITREVKAYMGGFYGRPPAPMNEELVRKTLGDTERIDKRPADYLEPMLDKIRRESGHLAACEEDLLSLALFPDIASKFLRERYYGDIRIDRDLLEQNDGFEGIYPFA